MNAFRHIATLVCTSFLALGAFAQSDPLVDALTSYRTGDLEQARVNIDRAVALPDHERNAEAWLLRGFVYKDIYKSMTQGSAADTLREVAMVSLDRCLVLDTAEVYRENAMQAREFLVRSYFNDAAKALGEMDDERALILYERFKEVTLKDDPKAQIRIREAEFMNALGTVYTKKFNEERTDLDLFDKAVSAYEHVLSLEPDNYGANYNLATLFYNRGVFRIREISAEDDIPSIQQIQEVARDFFMQALPYMLKAHDMNPQRKETLLGLEGIYYSLQDQDNSDKFRRLFEEMLPQE